jgi:DNA-binding NarL/FixJ family response regulator
LVVDDHEVIRKKVCRLLATQPDFIVVCEASAGREAVLRASEHQPDVVVLDISLPDLNGLLAAPLIKKASPAAEILIVTNNETSFFVREALSAGARGFLCKSQLAAELIRAVRDVHAKKRFVSEAVTLNAKSGNSPGTERAGKFPN